MIGSEHPLKNAFSGELVMGGVFGFLGATLHAMRSIFPLILIHLLPTLLNTNLLTTQRMQKRHEDAHRFVSAVEQRRISRLGELDVTLHLGAGGADV